MGQLIPGRLKGQTMQVEEMIKLALIILIFSVSVLVIIGATGGLTSVLNDFCEKNPKWCGASSADDDDYKIAKASVNALVCAINTVASGNIWAGSGCAEFYGTPSQANEMYDIYGQVPSDFYGTGSGSDGSDETEYIAGGGGKQVSGQIISKDFSDFMTGLATAAAGESSSKPMVHCEPIEDVDDICCEYDNDFGTDYEWLSTSICVRIGGSQHSDSSKCGTRKQKCTLYNFQLPQSFEGTAKASEWINGYGDPLFLVYWQAFPPGESADWDSESAWFKGSGTLFFGAMCLIGVKRSVTSAIRGGASLVTSSSTKAASYLASKIKGLKGASQASKEGAEGVVKVLERESEYYRQLENYYSSSTTTVTKVSRNSFLDKAMPYIVGALKKSGEGSKGYTAFSKIGIATKTVAYTSAVSGIVGLESYIASRADSEFGKFFRKETDPDKIMLQMPLNEREEFSLKTSDRDVNPPSIITDPSTENIVKTNKPVLLSKSGYDIWLTRIGEELKPFYLASPCKTDLKISEQSVLCSSYSYDVNTGEVSCETPAEYGRFFDGVKKFFTKTSPSGCGSLIPFDEKLIVPDDLINREAAFIQDMDTVRIFEDNVNIIDATRENGKSLQCSCYSNMHYDPVEKTGKNLTEILDKCYEYDIDIKLNANGKTKEYFEPDVKKEEWREFVKGIREQILVSHCEEIGTSSGPASSNARRCTCNIGFSDDLQSPFAGLSDSLSYPVYGISDTEAGLRCKADYNAASAYGRPLMPYTEPTQCTIYQGSFPKSSEKYYRISNPLTNEDFYYNRNSKNIEYVRASDGSMRETSFYCEVRIGDSSTNDNDGKFLDAIGIPLNTSFYWCRPSSSSAKIYIIGTLEDDGVTLHKFNTLRFDYRTTNEAYYTTGSKATYGKSIIIRDSSTISSTQSGQTGEEIVHARLDFDGLADEFHEITFLNPSSSINPSSNDITYIRSYNDYAPYDGKPDFAGSSNCIVDAVVIIPDTKKYDDEEGPNYCYKKNYRGALDVATTVASIGVSTLTKAAKIGGPIGWAVSTAVDCTIAVVSATVLDNAWPGD